MAYYEKFMLKKIFVAVVKDFRFYRLAHYELMIVLGIVLAKNNFPVIFSAKILLSYVLLAASLYLACLFSLITNNIADIDIDKISNKKRPLITGAVDIATYKKLGKASLFLTFLFAFSSGVLNGLIICLFLFNYYIYSAPPLRLKRITFLSKLCISINSFILVLSGYLLACGTANQFPLSIILYLLIFFTAAINFIDIKDYEGDLKAGIKTLPVVLGLKNSKRLIGVFYFIAYLATYLLLKQIWLLLILIPTGAVQYILINKENYQEKNIFRLYILSLLGLILFLLIY
jgi:4-hydroxybenzoate polyprenyltransferase